MVTSEAGMLKVSCASSASGREMELSSPVTSRSERRRCPSGSGAVTVMAVPTLSAERSVSTGFVTTFWVTSAPSKVTERV